MSSQLGPGTMASWSDRPLARDRVSSHGQVSIS
jgi:hypothetical protein